MKTQQDPRLQPSYSKNYALLKKHFSIIRGEEKLHYLIQIFSEYRQVPEEYFMTSNSILTKTSIPIVEMKELLKESSANRNNRHVFPTPLSPIRRSLKRQSYVLDILGVSKAHKFKVSLSSLRFSSLGRNQIFVELDRDGCRRRMKLYFHDKSEITNRQQKQCPPGNKKTTVDQTSFQRKQMQGQFVLLYFREFVDYRAFG